MQLGQPTTLEALPTSKPQPSQSTKWVAPGTSKRTREWQHHQGNKLNKRHTWAAYNWQATNQISLAWGSMCKAPPPPHVHTHHIGMNIMVMGTFLFSWMTFRWDPTSKSKTNWCPRHHILDMLKKKKLPKLWFCWCEYIICGGAKWVPKEALWQQSKHACV